MSENILPSFPKMSSEMKHVPIIGDKYKIKKEKEKEAIRAMLNNPEMANRLEGLAKALNENFNKSTQLLINIRAGARFTNTINKKIYAYEYFAVPFPHDLRAQVIMEFAGKPFFEFDDAEKQFVLIYEADAPKSGRYLMTTLDFCKYVACQIFEIEDYNDQSEQDFLKTIVCIKMKNRIIENK